MRFARIALVAALALSACSSRETPRLASFVESTAYALPNGWFSFDPRSISNCVVSLRADEGVTLTSGAVSTWANRTGDSSGDATQTTAAWRPTVTASALNGQPSITYTASKTLWWNPSIGNGAKSLVVVMRDNPSLVVGGSNHHIGFHTSGGAKVDIAQIDTVSPWLDLDFTVDDAAGATNVSFLGCSTGFNASWHYYILVYNGGSNVTASSYAVSWDGVAKTISTAGSYNASITDFSGFIGGGSSDGGSTIGTNLIGDVAEVDLYSKALNTDEQTAIVKYLKARYAMSLGWPLLVLMLLGAALRRARREKWSLRAHGCDSVIPAQPRRSRHGSNLRSRLPRRSRALGRSGSLALRARRAAGEAGAPLGRRPVRLHGDRAA